MEHVHKHQPHKAEVINATAEVQSRRLHVVGEGRRSRRGRAAFHQGPEVGSKRQRCSCCFRHLLWLLKRNIQRFLGFLWSWDSLWNCNRISTPEMLSWSRSCRCFLLHFLVPEKHYFEAFFLDRGTQTGRVIHPLQGSQFHQLRQQPAVARAKVTNLCPPPALQVLLGRFLSYSGRALTLYLQGAIKQTSSL